MKATVTSKGQVTIPQAIRDKAGIVAGSLLDFQLKNENTLIVHFSIHDISDLKGIIKSKRKKPVSLKEMKKAIADGATERMRRL